MNPGRNKMKDMEIKKELVAVAKRCNAAGLQRSDGGNLSYKYDEEHMIIMVSQSSFADCTTDDFILTDLHGIGECEGRKPSRECILHGAIYERFDHVKAIVHCHAPYATAYSSMMRTLDTATYHSVIKLNGNIMTFDTGNYIVSEEEAKKILESYREDEMPYGFLLKKHGAFAMGSSLKHACFMAELIEETAKIAIFSELLGGKQTIR